MNLENKGYLINHAREKVHESDMREDSKDEVKELFDILEKIPNAIKEIDKKYAEMVDGKIKLSISDYHNFVLEKLYDLYR